jgi:hypothetical protein
MSDKLGTLLVLAGMLAMLAGLILVPLDDSPLWFVDPKSLVSIAAMVPGGLLTMLGVWVMSRK